MGIFKRIADIFKSNVNDMIDRAEDPQKMLDQMVHDMESNYRDAKVQVAKAIADEKKLLVQLEQNKKQVSEWEKKAIIAVEQNRDDLAKEALKRKNSYAELANGFETQWQEQKKVSEQLKGNLRGLENKIDEAKRKKNLLVARAKRAEAQKTIHKAMSKMSDTGAFATFARMEDKVLAIESETSAALELDTDSLDDQFKALEAGSGVDDELAALKKQIAEKSESSQDTP
ncbi:PspA/IM30 family protein [bacterium]|nr:PspA/IM30 family protein [bacterium]